MSVNSPPNPNISTFNNEYWVTSNVTLTQADADLRYLKFPVAQGTETFSILTTNTPTVADNTTTVPNTSWVQTAITNAIAPTYSFLAFGSNLTLNNQDYIFLTGALTGGTLTLPVSTIGRQITIRKVSGTGSFTISPDIGVSLYDTSVTSGSFVMTSPISSVTLCYTSITSPALQVWLVIAVR